MKRIIYVLLVLILGTATFAQTVTFKVDMRIKTKKGQFNPATDSVRIAGSFNNWSTTVDNMVKGTDTVYTITKTLTVNDTLAFKFFATGALGWEADPNRSLIVQTGTQTYTAYFNRDSVYSQPKPILLNFVADMTFERFSGRFNTSRPDTLTVRGDFNGWSGTTFLQVNPLNPNLYLGSFQDTLGVGETINYKYAYITAAGVTWENDPNKTYTVTEADYAAGTATLSRVFNNLTANIITNNEVKVTFMVDVTNAVSSITNLPFPSMDNVVIAGANAPLQWPGGGWPNSDSAKVIKLFNDGTHGDSVANDKIWSREITFPVFSPLRIEYKFGANWGLPSNTGSNDNESSVGTNHWIRLNTYTVSGKVRNVWATMDTMNIYSEVTGIKEVGSGVPDKYSLDQNYPNPFNPSTIISFSIPEKSNVTLKVYDVLGKEVATLLSGEMNTGSYKVSFDAKNLTSGVYSN